MALSIASWAKPLLNCKTSHIGIKGGRGSGKSHTIATLLVLQHIQNQDAKHVCIREVQTSIKYSSKQLIINKILESGFSHLFEIEEKVIKSKNGTGIFIFTGMQDHTADSIKSLEGMDGAWVEEGQRLSKRSLSLLTPTIREAGSQIYFTWNPEKETDAVDVLFRDGIKNRPEDFICFHVNWGANPFLSKKMRKEAISCKKFYPDEYAHIWLGQYIKDDEQSFIKSSWLHDCINASQKLNIAPSGVRSLGLDVADDNRKADGTKSKADKSAVAVRHGFSIIYCADWDGADVIETSRRALSIANDLKAEKIIYDSIGVGAGVSGYFKQNKTKIRAQGFNAGGAVINPEAEIYPDKKNRDMFFNAKAQAWWNIRERAQYTSLILQAMKNGDNIAINEDKILSIDCENKNQLIMELSAPRIEYTENGKVKVESKKTMLERGIKSPNIADAIVMAFLNHKTNYQHLL